MFWQAPVGPRLTIVALTDKLLDVLEIASQGLNMGFDGESEVCPFGENGRRHGTQMVNRDFNFGVFFINFNVKNFKIINCIKFCKKVEFCRVYEIF